MKPRSEIYIFIFILFLYLSSIFASAIDAGLNRSYSVRVVIDHVFLSKKNDSLEVSETVVFRNEGPEIRYGQDNHTFFAISTPQGAKNLKTEVMECCLVEEDGMVLMDPMRSIKPGDSFEMQISYTLVPREKEYIFNKSTVYNTTSLSIFVGREIAEGSFEPVTLGGNKYEVIAFNDLEAGEIIRIPVKMVEKSDYLYAFAFLLFLLFLIGLLYRFRGKTGRRAYTLEELELEKTRIFQKIYGFEKHAQNVSSPEYRRLMEEYRQEAIRILIKMDKIKNYEIQKTEE